MYDYNSHVTPVETVPFNPTLSPVFRMRHSDFLRASCFFYSFSFEIQRDRDVASIPIVRCFKRLVDKAISKDLSVVRRQLPKLCETAR